MEFTADISKYVEQVMEFALKHPMFAISVLVVGAIVVIFIFVPQPMLRWMDVGERLNQTAAKRRKGTKKTYRQIAEDVIILALVLLCVLWALHIMSEKEQEEVKEPETDAISSDVEIIEEDVKEPQTDAISSDAEIIEEEEIHYVVVQANVTWKEAEKACEEDGGHLATITSREEYEQVVDVLDSYILENGSSAEDIFYVWLGGRKRKVMTSSDRGWTTSLTFVWITDEEWSDEIDRFWCNITSDDGTQISEPSYTNASTGIEENCLILWRKEMTLLWAREEVKLRWTFSDQNADLPDLSDSSTDVKGHIAYICEYDDYYDDYSNINYDDIVTTIYY